MGYFGLKNTALDYRRLYLTGLERIDRIVWCERHHYKTIIKLTKQIVIK